MGNFVEQLALTGLLQLLDCDADIVKHAVHAGAP
jgi:hypothetical protein